MGDDKQAGDKFTHGQPGTRRGRRGEHHLNSLSIGNLEEEVEARRPLVWLKFGKGVLAEPVDAAVASEEFLEFPADSWAFPLQIGIHLQGGVFPFDAGRDRSLQCIIPMLQ